MSAQGRPKGEFPHAGASRSAQAAGGAARVLV
jgi:hypothetical protein